MKLAILSILFISQVSFAQDHQAEAKAKSQDTEAISNCNDCEPHSYQGQRAPDKNKQIVADALATIRKGKDESIKDTNQ